MGRYDFLLKRGDKPTTPLPEAKAPAGSESDSKAGRGDEPHPFALRGQQARQEDQNLGTKETRKQGTLEARKEVSKEPSRRFNLNDQPYQNNTYSFTSEELDALEDVKIDLRRKMDIKTTKNEIIRAGLHTIVEDYLKNGDKSTLVKKIKEKGRA